VRVKTARERHREGIGALLSAPGYEPSRWDRVYEVVQEADDGRVVAYGAFAVVGRQAIGLDIRSAVGGSGSRVMRACFRLARRAGARVAFAACKRDLVAWHLRQGYEVCGYSESYYPDGEPAVVMRRAL
jgi:hypothetical protein